MPPRRPAPNLPGFTLVEWLGGGGFADVFRYHDHSLDREVAIKVLHRGGTDKARQAFRNEASLMARLSSHPNIVSVFQVGVADDGRPFLVMEMCAPQHLGDAIARRPYGPAKAMELGIQIAGAVETAHRLGVLHRDIKPSNIMFTAFARPALTDFGISVSLGGDTSMQMAMSHLWASPEQFGSSPGKVGPWSDVYSLAATVWALLIGHSPMFIPGDSNDRLSLEARIRTMPTPRTMRADVPEELERVLAVGMAKDPRERFQSAIEFARALQSIQGLINQPVTSIDVFTEPGQVLDDESELLDEGTRISGFQLIDPDRPDSTSHATGPTSGTTAPDQSGFSTGGHGAYTVPGPVLQHGRGVAAPGLRDFTFTGGQPAPEPQEIVEVPGTPPAAPAAPAERRRTPWRLLVSLGTALVVVIGAVLVFVLNQGRAASTPDATGSPTRSAHPADPLVVVPAVTGLAGRLDGDKATFTWTNPAPESGDLFRYAVLDPRSSTTYEKTTETTVTVSTVPGETCLEVTLIRKNGRASVPVRGCAQ
jgi:putative non-specific serine/threonine protein kinase